MGVFETLEKNRSAIKVVVALLVVTCGGVIYWQLHGPRQPDPSLAYKAFYTDDEGSTWFLDDVSKGSPFDHQGKQAYRALVFRCGAGRPFVAFLAKFSDQQNAEIARLASGTPSIVFGQPLQVLKKPGESKWETNKNSETGYPEVKCPDGTGAARLVQPVDPDTGATN